MGRRSFYPPPPSCDICGRFLRTTAPGVSWGQTWSYCMDGSPDLNDPRYRCSPCTDARGMPPSNCVGSQFQGRNAKGGAHAPD
jgi:hypothetical protein